MLQVDNDTPTDQLGRRVSRLLGIPATDFIDQDIISAEYERNFARMLLLELAELSQSNQTGILGLMQMANKLSRRLRCGPNVPSVKELVEGPGLPEPPSVG